METNAYPGTTYDRTRGKWKGQYRSNGKTKSVGYYPTQEEAYAAVQQAKDPDAPQATTTAYQLQAHKVQPGLTVAQSNVLIERPWTMTILEARIFVLLLRGLKRDETESRRIVVPLADLVGNEPIGGRGYQLLHAALKGIDAIRIELPVANKKQDFRLAPLVHTIHLDSGQGTFSGYFSPDVLPYLTNLADSFTLGQVADLLSIRSPNTYKMYWLLKSWEFRSPITVQVDRLRELTSGLGAYEQFAEYRRNVLKPAVAELNELSLDVSFVEHKVGRVVDKVEFHIKTRKHHKTQQLRLPMSEAIAAPEKPKALQKPQLTEMQQRVVTRLSKLKLTEAQVRKVLTELTTEADLTKLLKETYPVLRDFETKAKPGENVAAATMALLKSTFPAIWAAN
jgi:hypothetical protein